MAKKGFDLAALAKQTMGTEAVSELDTVELIPAERIRANEANFYEMSDLEELAASIELTGLLHPVIVKLDPEGGAGYVLIDGERRFRAMTEVLGRKEVPCRRVTPVNEVIEELMLIEANRTQRKMSSADLSRQAERYTELLAKLRDSGVPIPGRLRKAVAEAMQVSETKLARLSAIRKNLNADLLELFDKGELNESTAYEYSKLSAARQVTVAGDNPNKFASDIPALAEQAEKCFDFRACPYGGACRHGNRMFDRCLHSSRWNWCPSSSMSCCKTCYHRFGCTYVCGNAADDIENETQANKAERERREAEWKQSQAERDKARKDKEARRKANADRAWAFFRQRREELGIQPDDTRLRDIFGYGFDEDCESYETRAEEGIDLEDSPVDILCVDEILDLIGLLECSADELLGLERVSDSDATGLDWHETGKDGPPPEDARNVICWGDAGLYKPLPHLLRQEFEIIAENCRWWAVVDGPEG